MTVTIFRHPDPCEESTPRGPKIRDSHPFSLLLLFLLLPAPARGDFTAANVLVLANGSVAESVSLAEDYIRARGLDHNRLLTLPLPATDRIERDAFERDLVQPIRNELTRRGLAKDIRVIVPVFGVPLIVDPPPPEPFVAEYEKKLRSGSYRFLPPVMPTLPEILSWKHVLERSSGWDAVSLLAHLAYLAGRQASLEKYFDDVQKRFGYDESLASVDSELAFLWYDREQYILRYRLASPFYHGQGAAPGPFPLLLVSRIDGSTPRAARRLFEQAIEAEKNGLAGKCYLDARGLAKENGGLGEYDEEIRKLSAVLSRQTLLPVVLDNEERRFSALGAAPDTAMYSGWYRLRHYEDAFTFRPGAIGYHIASEELVSLHDAWEQGWCKNAIDHGITATLGPVAEPYVDSFPSPLEFFGLIATGRYSLIEVYALTSRSASWRMVLLADPLYHPFRGKPLISPEALVQMPEWPLGLRPLPVPPSEMVFPDPLVLREAEPAVLRRAISEVSALFEPQISEKSASDRVAEAPVLPYN